MKVVILAGGFGSRITEESQFKPKPMVEIGDKPILWHIMKIYSHYGFNEFVICLGYKGYMIKEYFSNYFYHMSDMTIDLTNNSHSIHQTMSEPWKITLINTGLNTMTGGRIKKIKDFVGDSTFLLTYGDGVSNVNIKELVKFHKQKGKYATLTAVQPMGRFGSLDITDDCNVHNFQEKPKGDGGWINGGFFVLEPEIFDYLQDDNTVWEKDPLEKLAKQNQLAAYKHLGFWKAMDTIKDKLVLENLLESGNAEWVLWG